MHIEVLQENLIKGLNSVCRVISNHSLVPILSNVYLSAKDGELKLTGGNGEIFIDCIIGAKVLTPGEICLPTRTLQELVSSLDAGKIEIKIDKEVAHISCGRFKGKINGQSSADYPKTDFKANNSSQKVAVNDLKNALEKLLFCAAVDESRPALTGISFKKTANGLQLASTDAFRLSVVELKLDLDISDLIVPAKVLTELLRLCAEEKQTEAQIIINQGELVFVVGENKIFSRLISSTFPNYEKIIPTNSAFKVILATSQFQKTVKTAAIFARGNSNIVKINIDGAKKITLTASAAGIGEQEQEVEGKFSGKIEEDFSIAFNCRYLLDFLAVASDQEEISLEMSTPLLPAIFRLPNVPGFLHVIMPVRI